MKANAIGLILFGIMTHASAKVGTWHSPDHKFLATCVPRNIDGTGSRLLLSVTGKPDSKMLLRENDRWIEVSWSPDSKFLALTDGSDGHVTDIFLYRVQASDANDTKVKLMSLPAFGDIAKSAHTPGIRADIWYHTPNIWTYDVKWEFVGWADQGASVKLTKHSRASKDEYFKISLKPPADLSINDAGMDAPGHPSTSTPKNTHQ